MTMNVREQIWGYQPLRSPKRRRKVTKPAQRSLAHVRTWGGPRPGAGRKKGPRPKVRHRTRGEHRRYQPVHLTLRRARGLPSFRSQRIERLLRQAIADTQREGFRIVEYSVQADHVHMIIEADDSAHLTRGMRSFTVRVAMRVNRRIFQRRSGRVWGDRYHRHDLKNPTEVRNAIVYVLNNHLKHHELDVGLVDPCSSAPWFQGWMQSVLPPPEPRAVAPPRTWLLRTGWTTASYGLIKLGELPRALRR